VNSHANRQIRLALVVMQLKNKNSTKMKKLLLILMFTQFLVGCSKDESPTNEPSVILSDNILDKLKQEYNITKDGLFLESFSYGKDTTQLFINGRLNEKLWIGCYNKRTKNKILEWTESEKLDTIFNLHIGYGEYSDFNIGRFFIRYPYYNNGQLYFLLWGYNDKTININGRIISSDLYFIKNNSFIKKRSSFSFPIDDAFYQNIIPWKNSIFSKYQNKYICFSTDGDSLYSADKIVANYEPISIEECIEFNANNNTSDERMYYFRRLNLKTNEAIWKNEDKPLANIPANDRLDSTVIQKNSNIWDYSFFYTRIEGTRYAIQLELNIESGKLITK
jgi:hypothetical protein